jgi:hypothetical protein
MNLVKDTTPITPSVQGSSGQPVKDTTTIMPSIQGSGQPVKDTTIPIMPSDQGSSGQPIYQGGAAAKGATFDSIPVESITSITPNKAGKFNVNTTDKGNLPNLKPETICKKLTS